MKTLFNTPLQSAKILKKAIKTEKQPLAIGFQLVGPME
jgi:hypothetical protein